MGSLVAKEQIMELNKEDIIKTVKIQNIKNGKQFSQEVFIVESPLKKTNSITNTIEYAFANGNKFNSKSKIMIKFKNESVNTKMIESQYGLNFERKMSSGDYLFTNKSGNTLDIINMVIKNESANILRISPNLILNMKPM